MSTQALHNFTLKEAADKIRAKEVSSVELTQHSIDRLNDHAEPLNCLAALYTDDALASAKQADARQNQGDDLGLLHGVPLAHKDMYYRKGWLCENGSKIRKGFRPDITSTAISKLDGAGAVDIARLNMVEFALGITGHNEVTGHVRNPWNTDYITGGSSSGSGAAIAARLTYGSLGSDTGGSIRLPAACCGITGIKPTYSRVSRYGAMPLAHSLDCVGPLARTAEDCALLLKVIAGQDKNDPLSSPRSVPDYTANLEKSVKGLRVGVPENYFYDPVSDEVRALLTDSLDVMRDAGAEIIPVKIPDSFASANLLSNIIGASEGAAFHSRWLRDCPEDYGSPTLTRFFVGSMVPATTYFEAVGLRAGILASFVESVFSKVDVLHTPMIPTAIPTIEETDFAKGIEGFAEFIVSFGHCVRGYNYMGLPSASIPCGFSGNGLPVSFQLAARPFDEAIILHMAHAYQKETDWHMQAPSL